MQAQPARQVVSLAFGKHLAMLIGMKAVHHDPVQPGHAAHFGGHAVAEAAQAGGRLQATNGRLEQGEVVPLRLAGLPAGGLELQHCHPVHGVNANVERSRAFARGKREGIQHVALQRLVQQHVLQVGAPLFTYHAADALAEQR